MIKKKILIVDDGPDILELVQYILQRSGYEVKTASNGQEALETVKAERPDLVILDIMMPGMNGYEVLGKLRADPSTQHLPVIMLTARGGDTDVADSWHKGVDTYLTKPFEPKELLTFVGRLAPISDQ